MRRIAPLAVLAFLLMTGTASAVTNTLSFDIAAQMSETPATNRPAPLAYEWAQDVGTNPPGQQPDTGGQFNFYFDRNIASNGQYFPSCGQSQIDGQPEIPDACKPAIVGNGVATVYAGSPGSPIANSIREDLTVTLLNGTPAGEEWLLYLRSNDGAPVFIRRVIPGSVIPLSEASSTKYGFAVQFDVPYDLQTQLGLEITMTKLVVNVPSYMHVVQFEGKSYSASFLVAKACSGSLFGQDTVFFRLNSGYYGYPPYPEYPPPYPTPYPNPNYGLIAEDSTPCVVGPGFSDYPPFYPPEANDFPRLPGQDGSTGGGDNGGGGNNGGGGDNGGGGGGTPPGPEGPPPGGNPGGGPPPTTPPPPGIRGGGGKPKTVTVNSDGTFTLPGVTVICPAGGGTCTVNGDAIGGAGASKVAILAKVRFRLAAGKSSKVKLRLTRKGKQLLKRKKLLKLTVRLRIREANGAQTKRNIKTRVKARKPRH